MARNNDFIKNIDKHVGARIHDFRIEKGLSRQMLATKVGITHQQLAKYEHGVNRISVGRLLLICKELNKHITSFVESYDDIKNHDIVLAKERITMELVRSFNSIGDEKIKEAINNLTRIISK
jgi:transcriptional regulator with XRE-family HTH domain